MQWLALPLPMLIIVQVHKNIKACPKQAILSQHPCPFLGM
jgi:hypothetical protein